MHYFTLLSVNRFWGNKFQVDLNAPPWNFPLDNLPFYDNITTPPTTESSAIENYPSIGADGHNKKGLGPGGIAFICGAALVATSAALFVVIRINRAHAPKPKGLDGSNNTLHSIPMTTDRGEGTYWCIFTCISHLFVNINFTLYR